MVCVPAPAVAGLKIPPLTPVPEYVPPAGEPPVRVKAGASIQISFTGLWLTEGSELMTILRGEVSWQPVEIICSVTETDPLPAVPHCMVTWLVPCPQER